MTLLAPVMGTPKKGIRMMGKVAIFRKAQADNSLPKEQDLRALARFFVGVSQGMAVLNKTFADPSVIRDVAKVALSVWGQTV